MHPLTLLPQARVAEYFGVSRAMIAARQGLPGRFCSADADADDVLAGLKKSAEEKYEE